MNKKFLQNNKLKKKGVTRCSLRESETNILKTCGITIHQPGRRMYSGDPLADTWAWGNGKGVKLGKYF